MLEGVVESDFRELLTRHEEKTEYGVEKWKPVEQHHWLVDQLDRISQSGAVYNLHSGTGLAHSLLP